MASCAFGLENVKHGVLAVRRSLNSAFPSREASPYVLDVPTFPAEPYKASRCSCLILPALLFEWASGGFLLSEIN